MTYAKDVSFGGSAVITLRWPDFLASAIVGKNLSVQFVETAESYTVFSIDGKLVYVCKLLKTDYDYPSLMPDYSKEQNDLDRADFEARFKATANGNLELRTRDGRLTVRDSTANRTTNFKLRVFSFYTARLDGLHNVSPVTNADYGDATVTLYDAGGALLAPGGEAAAVKTVIDWEPRYNYELIGGSMDLPVGLAGGQTDSWFISAIGVPDYPPQFFGSVDYISEVNLEAVTTQKILSDGRAVSYLAYNYGGMPHTNKLRFIVKHPAGAQKRFQLYIEHFS